LSGAFDELAVLEGGAGAHERDEVGCVDGAPAGLGVAWAAWMSLKAMAMPAAFDPGPFVILLRWRTVAKVDSIGLAPIFTQRIRPHSRVH
jgi:hypothetical protein